MKRLSADALRELYLSFFEEKGHKRLPSASLVPHGDPSMLLTSAGMVPFKPYFLGLEKPEHQRLTTCQRCLRTPDIDNVGITDRHGTFFEMLGNFSFGDYFKREAIAWAWEFITERLELSPADLWVSIYYEDDEAFHIWHDDIGLPADRIVRLGREDNFWEIGVGPCGPSSEIFVDRGNGCGHDDCKPGCQRCERFFEIWNLVFIQFDQDAAGNLTPLPMKSIDTGMGLERTAAFLQGVTSIFEIDNIRPIIDFVAKKARTAYGAADKTDVSLRVITDHMRGVVLLVMDGVLPSNEGRGYVLRRLLRRAARHAHLLGIREPVLGTVADIVRQQLGHVYPQLSTEYERIVSVINQEEARFHETLDQGLQLLEQLLQQLERQHVEIIAGEDAFRLYDTYGFPLELTEEVAAGRGFKVDHDGFQTAMENQRRTAREARAKTAYLDAGDTDVLQTMASPPTEFIGYETTVGEGTITVIANNGVLVDEVDVIGSEVHVVLDRSPFYPEGGGQVGDVGTLTSPHGQMEVLGTTQVGDRIIVHHGQLVSGRIGRGQTMLATVDGRARLDTARHHTATHLLHKALHEILGNHATQAGSLVAPDRLRFDFAHFKALSRVERQQLEQRVNDYVLRSIPVQTDIVPHDEALRRGAMALFGEKYGDDVRLVSIGQYSLELCGGTHVSRTGDVGLFKIIAESAVASGVRRIEAVAGHHALDYVNRQEHELQTMAEQLQVGPWEVGAQLDRLQSQVKDLERQIAQMQVRASASAGDALAAQAMQMGGLNVVIAQVQSADVAGMRNMGDTLRGKLKDGIIVLGSVNDGKVSLIAMCTDKAVATGIKANDIIRHVAPIVHGGGGGSPTMAQAGGKSPEQLEAALEAAQAFVEQQLG